MRILLITLFTMFSVATVEAQQTDFSGTWLFKDQASISGKLYSNGSPKQIKATQNAGAITIERLNVKPNGEEVASIETIGFNGKPFEKVTASKRKKVVILKWANDGKSFTETALLYSLTDSSKPDFKVTDTWRLEDGKLTMVRKDENFTNGEVWESKATYEKQ